MSTTTSPRVPTSLRTLAGVLAVVAAVLAIVALIVAIAALQGSATAAPARTAAVPEPSCEPIRVAPREAMTRAEDVAEAVAAAEEAHPDRPVEILPYSPHGEDLLGADVLVRTGWAGARVNLQHAPQVWLNLDSFDPESPSRWEIVDAIAAVIPACEAEEVTSG